MDLKTLYVMHGMLSGTPRTKRTLKKNVVPSVFTWSKEPSSCAKIRTARATLRMSVDEEEASSFVCDPALDVQEIVIDDSQSGVDEEATVEFSLPVHNTSQTPPLSKVSIEGMTDDPKTLQYFTGLDSYRHFRYVMQSLGPGAYHVEYRWRSPQKISVENQLLLKIIKLRLHEPNQELAFLFGVSEFRASNIFVTWINFMYCSWKELDIWPSRELVDENMPSDFKRLYLSTSVIIDGMEIPIKKPGKPTAKQVTYSTYKNRNALKVLVGIIPGGLVSYVTPAYGGSASGRILVERGDLPHRCAPGDSIMSDKGFNVQDIFAPFNVKVNIPTCLRKKIS